MRLSTKTRYGTRLMLELGINYKKGYVQLSEIARNQDISEKYSEQIISQLKVAGLVLSQRGAQGGYILARASSRINLREIVETLEGSLTLLECLEGQDCEKSSECITQRVWKKLSDAMAATLEKITLEDLVNDAKRSASVLNYDI